MRLVVLTMEGLAGAGAVRRFLAAHRDEIVLVGISDPYRKAAGGRFGQLWRHLRRSGPRILPYLLIHFALPELLGCVARACRRLGITCLAVGDVRGAAFGDALRNADADLIVTFHFDQILDARTLALTRLGGVNVHPSLLPAHRGPVPAFHAAREDAPRFGVTVHRLVPQIDAGPILAQQAVMLPPGLSAGGIAIRLHDAGGTLLDAVLADFPARDAAARPQGDAPYCGFPTAKDLRAARQRHVALSHWRDAARLFSP